MVFNEFKDQNLNKFDLGIFYVFNVEIIKISFKCLLIICNIFSLKFVISIFLAIFFCYFYVIFLNFHYFFHFSHQELPSWENLKPKIYVTSFWGVGGNSIIETKTFTKFNCFDFLKSKKYSYIIIIIVIIFCNFFSKLGN